MSEFFSDEETKFRMDACLKKMLGKPLTEAEREVIRDVNRIQGWDRAAQGIETAKPPRRATGLAREGESPVGKADAPNSEGSCSHAQ